MNMNALLQYVQTLQRLQGYQPGAADRNRGMFLRPQVPDMPMTSWAQNIPDAQAQMPQRSWGTPESNTGVNSWREALTGPGGYLGWLQRELPGSYAGPPTAGWGNIGTGMEPGPLAQQPAYGGNTWQTTGADRWTNPSWNAQNPGYNRPPEDFPYQAPRNYGGQLTVANSPELRALRSGLERSQNDWTRRENTLNEYQDYRRRLASQENDSGYY